MPTEFLRFRAQRGTFAKKIAQYCCLVSPFFRKIFAFRPPNQDAFERIPQMAPPHFLFFVTTIFAQHK